MATEKRFETRHVQRHDIKENWDLSTTFIPLQGEFIIYDDLNKFKIGDGVTTVVNLDFATMSVTELMELINNNKLQISETQPSFACTWFRVTSSNV